MARYLVRPCQDREEEDSFEQKSLVWGTLARPSEVSTGTSTTANRLWFMDAASGIGRGWS